MVRYSRFFVAVYCKKMRNKCEYNLDLAPPANPCRAACFPHHVHTHSRRSFDFISVNE